MRFAPLFLLLTSLFMFTSCIYKSPSYCSAGSNPTTNNPDIIRKRAASQVMPGVGY